MKKLILFLTPLFLLACNSSVKKPDVNTETSSVSKESYSIRMGETVLKNYPDIWSIEGGKKPAWTYTYGLITLSLIDLWQYTNDENYYNYAKKYADILIDSNGIINTYKKEIYNIDKINSGKILFTLYNNTKDPRYKIALDTLRAQLKYHPRTKLGGFWHKKRYPHQMWLDGLYMGGPFYAQYAKEFNEPESFDEVAKWFINMEKVSRDSKTGLLYHAWDESKEQEWANKETGLSPNIWGRAMGWYGMALVDALDYFPKEYSEYDSIVAIVQRMAAAIVKYQDDSTGCWYQVVDKGNEEGNYIEGSVSSMFSYFLLKAINKNYIDKTTYRNYAVKAFEGTVKNLIKENEDGTLVLTPVCAVAGLGGKPYRDGSYEYYINEKKRDNDPKAVGPFIMAAIQYEKLIK